MNEEERLRNVHSAAALRELGHPWIDRLAVALSKAAERTVPVWPGGSAQEQTARFASSFPAEGGADLFELLERVLAHSTQLHHPGFVGHQVTAPLPLAALGELTSALLNNGMAVGEMGPAATAIEEAVIGFLADRAGYPTTSDGVLTSGGSIGNLTALLAARQKRAGFDLWEDGASAGPPLALLASDQAHYCVARAVALMGWGRRGVAVVGTDGSFRLAPEKLPAALDAATRDGRRVIAVVASACSTATGSFDPLEPIADFCTRQGLWLHVDAAHGAAALLAPKYRQLLQGIERADSFVADLHKMFLMPALATAVVFQRAADSYAPFAQHATYLFADDPVHPAGHDRGLRTLECTKRMIGLPFYLTLAVVGPALLGDYVTRCFELAAEFAALVEETADFELAVRPAANIVCFRHRPTGLLERQLDDWQQEVRRRLLASGAFYLVQTTLPAGLFLRMTLLNPHTTIDDLRELLRQIRGMTRT